MELTINVKLDVAERFCDVIELLAVALVKGKELPVVGVVKPSDMTKDETLAAEKKPINDKAADIMDNAASSEKQEIDNTAVMNTALDKLKTELKLEEAPVAAPTLTRAELQAKAARLMQIGKGKYAADLKASLAQCGAANISSLDESMFEKFNSLMADLWEAAA